MNQAGAIPTRARFIRFGLFEADLEAGELRKDGLKIKLQEQPFRVLSLLLERAGEVVTREELRQMLWSSDTFVDFEHSLNTSIKKLRQALGDDADNPRFVETLARRGYRFIAPVEKVGERPSSLSSEKRQVAEVSLRVGFAKPQAGQEQWSAKRQTPGVRWSWVIALTALSLAGATWWHFHRPSTVAPMKVVRFTSYSDIEKDPALSPDGTRLAFVWDGPGGDNFDIYLRTVGRVGELPLTTEKPLRLTTASEPDLSPAWSPDGRYIAFARVTEGNSGVYVVPAMGGEERKLTGLYSIPSGVKSLDWSTDGESLVVSAKISPEGTYCLYSVSLDTDRIRKLTSPPVAAFGGDVSPAFSPDGQTLGFTRLAVFTDPGEVVGIVGRNGALCLLSLNSGEIKRFLGSKLYGSSGAWTPDAREIVLATLTGQSRQLGRLSTSDGEARPLGIQANGILPTISRHGNRMAYVELIHDTDIWKVDRLNRKDSGIPPKKLIHSSQCDDNPQYSPDGKNVAFISNRSGSWEVYLSDNEGQNVRQLTSFPEAAVTGSPRWSPDGTKIAFDSWNEGRAKIFVVRTDGSAPVRISSDESAYDFLPTWSQDGRWILFCSNRSGDHQIWRMPAEGGTAARWTKKGGFESQVSPDGKTLYYTKLDSVSPSSGSAHLWSVPVGGGEESQVFAKAVYPRYWVVTDQGVYLVPSDWSPHSTIEFFSFATGQFTRVINLQKPPVPYFHPGLSISPDGRSILCSLVEQDTSDIMLVENFR